MMRWWKSLALAAGLALLLLWGGPTVELFVELMQ